MNASYKIALLAAVGLLVLVVGYYAARGPAPDDLTQLNPAQGDADPAGESDAPTGDTPVVQPTPRRTTPATPGPGRATPRQTPTAPTERAETPPAARGTGSVVEIGPPPTDPLTALILEPYSQPLDNSDTPATTPPVRPEPIVRATPEPPVTTVTTDRAPGPTVEATPPATPEVTPTPEPVVETPPAQPERTTRLGVPATYTVKPGDMLVHIAERFYGSQAAWEDIAQANPTVDPTRLRVGQELRLPAPAVAQRTRTEPPAPRPGTRERYTVKPGDNLTRIAERFYGDADQWDIIYNHNRDAIGPDPGRLKAGMTLDIPPAVAGAN